MADYKGKSPQPPTPLEIFDWVNAIVRDSFEVGDTKIDIYMLTVSTPLYRGDIDDFDNFDPKKSFDRPITWFGNYPTASLYGPVTEYQLKKVGFFFAMDTPNNIRWLKSQINSKERAALDETFQIKTKKGKKDEKEEYVYRTSEPIEDVIVANALCNLTRRSGDRPSVDGWIHLTMRSHNTSGFMGPEIMICNPARVVRQVKVFPFTDKTKLKELRLERMANREKKQRKRINITYLDVHRREFQPRGATASTSGLSSVASKLF